MKIFDHLQSIEDTLVLFEGENRLLSIDEREAIDGMKRSINRLRKVMEKRKEFEELLRTQQ